MPTKKDYEEMIIRVDERTRAIPQIEAHLNKLNGGVSKALYDSSNAERKATSTRKYLDKLIVGIIAGGLVFISSIVVLAAQKS